MIHLTLSMQFYGSSSWKERCKIIHKLQFHIFGKVKNIATKAGVAILLAALIVSTIVMLALASSDSGEVLTTSGHIEGYYYECIYTPTREKKSGHYDENYHSYYAEGYNVECKYTEIHPKEHEPKPEPKPEPLPESNDKYHCTYTVYKGDTLTQIARYYGISVHQMAKANHIKNSNYIRLGQVLYVPCHY